MGGGVGEAAKLLACQLTAVGCYPTRVPSWGAAVGYARTAVPKEGTAVGEKGTAVPKQGAAVPKKPTAVPYWGTAARKKGSAVPWVGTALPSEGTRVGYWSLAGVPLALRWPCALKRVPSSPTAAWVPGWFCLAAACRAPYTSSEAV